MDVTATINDSELKKLQELLEAVKRQFAAAAKEYAGVRIGIFEDATNNETGEKVAFYAACNEFGTKRIPSRPFMRLTAEKNAEKWAMVIRKSLEDVEPEKGMAGVLQKKYLKRAFDRVGIVGRNDMQEVILSNVPPPNNPKTVSRKIKRATAENANGQAVQGYAGTLVDTGAMYHSIGYRIVDSEGNYVDGQSS